MIDPPWYNIYAVLGSGYNVNGGQLLLWQFFSEIAPLEFSIQTYILALHIAKFATEVESYKPTLGDCTLLSC